jgi:prepilin-type processing-associated H-X9-DG protein
LPDRGVGGSTPLWRRADFLVAATLVLTALGLVLTWAVRLNRPDGDAAVVDCKDNLRKFHTALVAYSQNHHRHFPNVATAAKAPRNVAGLVVPILQDAGTLPPDISVRCPANGPAKPLALTLHDLTAMPPDRFNQHVHSLASCYAYTLGYRNQQGIAGLNADMPSGSVVPLMADCPSKNPVAGNSPNHGGKGQNVLYVDGHVKFCTGRNVGVEGDDIFVNKAKKVAAGLDPADSVLGSSGATP